MANKRNFIFLLMVVFLSDFCNAQPWLYESAKLKSTSKVLSFKEQQRAFYSYWNKRDVVRAKGQKQFKRWEYIMAPRLYNNETINSKALWDAIKIKPINTPSSSANWKFVGPDKTPFQVETKKKTGNGRLNCVAFHPTDANILYVGAPSGGFWKTTNGGVSWSTTTDKLDAIGVSDIVISHENPDHIFLATGDGDAGDTYGIGIIKSTDGGYLWDTTALSLDVTEGIYFRRIIMDPNNADIMLAASSNGIYKTTDGWNTFKQVQEGNFKDIEFKPGVSDYVYASSYNGGGNAGIFRSTNKGETFTKTTTGLDYSDVSRIELAVSPANSNYVYALACKASSGYLHSLCRSTNSGSSWMMVFDNNEEELLGWDINGNDGNDNEGQGWYDLSLAVSRTDINTLIAGGVNIWKSTTGGTAWTITGFWENRETSGIDYVHADQHMFAFSPLTNNAYAANDGGLYKSTDKGSSWEDISNDLQILQSYKMGISGISDGRIITGNQDNGTFLLTNSEWFEVLGGDGMECHIDPTDDNILYGSLYYGEISRSDDGGITFSSIKPASSGDGAWVTPLILHPVYPSILYVGYKDVYKSYDRGNTWTQLSKDLSTNALNNLAVAPSNDNYIYTSSGNTLFKSTDGGTTWNTVSNDLPNGYISSICISPNDHNEIWVSLSGYSPNQKVYYSNNGGTDWTNFSEGLPNIPANEVIFRSNTHKELYLATDIGIYYRHGDTNTWLNYSNNLPNVIVSDIEISEKFNKLRAATYGRGIWETELDKPVPAKTAFNANIVSGCPNAPITIVYNGTTEFDSLNWDLDEANIIYQSAKNDSLIFSFSTNGFKTIKLTHYYNGKVTNEINYNYIEIRNNIDILIKPEKQYVCNHTEHKVFLPNGYEYTVSPSESVINMENNWLTLAPSGNTTYSITAKHGECESKKELQLLIMPDNACSALYLPAGEISGIFSNACASIENKEPFPPVGSHSNSNGCVSQDGWCEGENEIKHSLWFKVTVPENGSLNIRAEGFDSKIALYKADNCNSLFQQSAFQLIAANDDKSDFDGNSEIKTISNLTPGDTLYLQVDGSYGGVVGEFTIEVTDGTTSIELPTKKTSNLVVFPNPAREQFTVRLIVPNKSKVDVDIISSNGNIVHSKQGVEEISFYEETFNAKKMKGLYILRIKTNELTLFKKFIVR